MFETANRHTGEGGHRTGLFGTPTAVAALVASIVIAALIVLAVLYHFSESLSDEFYQMSSESMNDFTLAQKVEVESSIREIKSTMSTMRVLAESPDIDPNGGTFTSYIESWNEKASFQVTYVAFADLKASVDERGERSDDLAILDELGAGESVISEVRKSNRLNGYYFSIAEPVVRGGEVVGVLRSIVEADKLVKTSQASSQVSLIGSTLIKSDGTIVAVNQEAADYDGKNLYELLKENGFSQETVDKARANVDNEHDVDTVTMGKRNGRMMFFSSIRLGVNDWSIVNFTEESALAEHSQVILVDTLVTGALLVGISIVACLAVAFVIGRFRRKALRDAERYAVLAEFSDTVLFEYFYRTDTLELTPNARSVFSLDALVRDKYMEDGISLIDFREEDYPRIRDMFEHPAQPGEARTITVRARVLAGEYRWFSFKCRYLYEGDRPYEAVGKIVDITQQREKEEVLKRKSQVDGLTGALNKVTAEERIARLLASEECGLLFVIDIDRFKLVNDEFGHSMGDRVLEAVAHSLLEVFRSGDLVGRIGGDEFVAFAAGADGDAVASSKRAALLERVASASAALGLPISLSIGIARYPRDGATYEALFDVADRLMYEEKHSKAR